MGMISDYFKESGSTIKKDVKGAFSIGIEWYNFTEVCRPTRFSGTDIIDGLELSEKTQFYAMIRKGGDQVIKKVSWDVEKEQFFLDSSDTETKYIWDEDIICWTHTDNEFLIGLYNLVCS